MTWNEELEGIIKIDEALEDAGLFLKGASKPVENEAKGGISLFIIRYIRCYIFWKYVSK